MLELSFFQIKNSREPLTQISADLTFADGFYQRAKDLVYEVKSAHVEGQLFYDEPFVTGNFQVEADLLVPSSRSLEAVPLKQKFSFVENYSDHEPTQEEKELGLMIWSWPARSGGWHVKIKSSLSYSIQAEKIK